MNAIIPRAFPTSEVLALHELREAGFALLWLHPRTKRPIGDDWSTKPVASLPELLIDAGRGNNLGVRLGEFSRVGGAFLHVLDIDIREPSAAKAARAKLADLFAGVDLDALPAVKSGSGGASLHLYFLSDRPYRSRKLAHSGVKMTDAAGKPHWTWEIELFGTGKQVAMPPSIHPNTGQPYAWTRPFDFEMTAMGFGPFVPSSVIDAIAGQRYVAGLIDVAPLGISSEQAAAALANLSLPDFCDDRDGWLRVGMALHHEYGGSAIGLKLWTDFSRQSDKFDADDIGRVWKSFRASKAKPVRMATIMQAAGAARIMGLFDEEDDIPAALVVDDAHGDTQAGDEFDNIEGAALDAREVGEDIGGDVINGRSFAASNRDRFRYVAVHDQWRRYRVSRWAACRNGEEIEASKRVAAGLLSRATAAHSVSPSDATKARRARAINLFTNLYKQEAMLKSARSEPGIATELTDFDSNPLQLGVPNGVIDLKTAKLIAPHPSNMISKQAGCAFDPAAECPTFDRFLVTIQPDAEIRDFLQRAVGYTMTGLVDEEVLLFAFGTGANGKSVFTNIIAAAFGEYAVTVGSKLLTKSLSGSTEADRLKFQLPGARLVLANETAAGDIWDDVAVKELASRERISARKLYQESFSFMPTHCLWIRGNHLPGAHDSGAGFWRRMIPIEFGTSIPDAERVVDLDRRIIASELPGVLAWAVRGCLEWQRTGLAVPKSIRREAARYRADTDVLQGWISACCIRGGIDAALPASAGYASFRTYCDEEGLRPPAKVAWSRQMTAKGFARHPDTAHRRFVGLALRCAFDEPGTPNNPDTDKD